MPPPEILIVGATGQQGSAVLAELSSLVQSTSTPKPKVYALTRNASSAKAQTLSTRYPALHLTLVEGDTRSPATIFEQHPSITAVFSYTTPPDETPQATALVDGAIGAGVKHFVFSSVERGGDERSWSNPTDIPHFREKHDVEVYLRDRCAEAATAATGGSSMTWTILRPTAFLDNLNPTSPFGPVFAGMWGTMPAERKLQLVSVRDIARFAVKALLDPAGYAGRAVGLAGDELTLLEARSVYRRVAGLELPQAWWIVSRVIRWAIGDVERMFVWFEKEGYAVDIDGLRAEEPSLQNLESWLRESSRFECGKGKGGA